MKKKRLEQTTEMKKRLEEEQPIDKKAVRPSKFNSAKKLLKLAKMAEELPSKSNAPRDVSENLDYYAWGGKKRMKIGRSVFFTAVAILRPRPPSIGDSSSGLLGISIVLMRVL